MVAFANGIGQGLLFVTDLPPKPRPGPEYDVRVREHWRRSPIRPGKKKGHSGFEPRMPSHKTV